MFTFDPPQRYLELIRQFRLIDDTFFDVCFDGSNECMQLLLNIFFKRNDIIVNEVVTQRSARNLYGRGVCFDVIAMDSNGKIYNVEVQRADEGANPKRARFNNALIDSREINRNTEYKDFPEIWVIFITENDIFGAQLPMYHIERVITELNQPFLDAAHIIYVNGEHKGNDALGFLMQDFFCADPAKMHYPELAKRANFFKYDEKGVKAMCGIMEKFGNELQAEARNEEREATAKEMLRDNKPMEEIIKYSHLPETRIKELAKRTK
ncbi:PD-(D/E)XK nuclease family transposase [Anaerovibrio sp. JC8]|uniref:PD-(D/E)XK nuclease family transposase n=1 Tax=Anaerovibrio sp. JC8 TaxID=1240085 RepID=UPI000A108BAA|nr:PD-(D/E)XK nuclease family transposase [Anaerovibrio sp. JC8]